MRVKTSNVPKAGTNAAVHVQFFGSGNKQSSKVQLNTKALVGKGVEPFERGRTDVFKVKADDIGAELTKIRIGHDNRGVAPSWHLDSVVVEVPTNGSTDVYMFTAGRALDARAGDRKTEIELVLAAGYFKPFQKSIANAGVATARQVMLSTPSAEAQGSKATTPPMSATDNAVVFVPSRPTFGPARTTAYKAMQQAKRAACNQPTAKSLDLAELGSLLQDLRKAHPSGFVAAPAFSALLQSKFGERFGSGNEANAYADTVSAGHDVLGTGTFSYDAYIAFCAAALGGTSLAEQLAGVFQAFSPSSTPLQSGEIGALMKAVSACDLDNAFPGGDSDCLVTRFEPEQAVVTCNARFIHVQFAADDEGAVTKAAFVAGCTAATPPATAGASIATLLAHATVRPETTESEAHAKVLAASMLMFDDVEELTSWEDQLSKQHTSGTISTEAFADSVKARHKDKIEEDIGAYAETVAKGFPAGLLSDGSAGFDGLINYREYMLYMAASMAATLEEQLEFAFEFQAAASAQAAPAVARQAHGGQSSSGGGGGSTRPTAKKVGMYEVASLLTSFGTFDAAFYPPGAFFANRVPGGHGVIFDGEITEKRTLRVSNFGLQCGTALPITATFAVDGAGKVERDEFVRQCAKSSAIAELMGHATLREDLVAAAMLEEAAAGWSEQDGSGAAAAAAAAAVQVNGVPEKRGLVRVASRGNSFVDNST